MKRVKKILIFLLPLLLLAVAIVSYFKIKKAIYMRNNNAEALAAVYSANKESFDEAASFMIDFGFDFIEIIRAADDAHLEKRNIPPVEKKMGSIKILTSEELTDEQYSYINTIFSDLFQSAHIITCYRRIYYDNNGEKELTRVCFLTNQYKDGVTEWYSYLYYDSEEHPDAKLQQLHTSDLGEQWMYIDRHWVAALERIN